MRDLVGELRLTINRDLPKDILRKFILMYFYLPVIAEMVFNAFINFHIIIEAFKVKTKTAVFGLHP